MFKVMFLCTANSCRSQMAEGLARSLGSGLIEPYSAGIMKAFVHPRAIAVMNELGIDISGHTSKEVANELLMQMDYVITLCDHAEFSCPRTPWTIQRMHWPIKDPVGTVGSDDVVLREFRRARDEIRNHIVTLIEDIKQIRHH